ncbi:MAG: hypothetical protein WCK65_11410 [Rhodospirillaceae bacterium]
MDDIRFMSRYLTTLMIAYEMAAVMWNDKLYYWLGITLPDPAYWVVAQFTGAG